MGNSFKTPTIIWSQSLIAIHETHRISSGQLKFRPRLLSSKETRLRGIKKLPNHDTKSVRTTSAIKITSKGGLKGAGSSPHVKAIALQFVTPFILIFSSIKPTKAGRSVIITSPAPR
jgi:hypothetical protein